MIMMCLSGTPMNSTNCFVLTNETTFKSERECEDAVASLVLDEQFQIVYEGYKPKKYACYDWDKESVQS
jgi:hypothetical protein